MDPQAEISRIDAEYAPRIAEAEEQERPAIQLERETKKNEVWSAYGQQQQRASALAAALQKYPRAPQTAVTGNTVDEIEASAKALHEHYDALLQQQEAEIRERVEAEARQRMYGRPTAAGGGSRGDTDGGATTQESQFETLMRKVQDTMVAGTGPITQGEHDRYIQGVGDLLMQRQVGRELPDGLEEKGSIQDNRIRYDRTRR